LIGFYLPNALESILARLDKIEWMLNLVLRKEGKIMASLQDDLDAITAQSSRLDSLNTFVSGLEAQLAEALSGKLSAEDQAKVDAIFEAVHVNDAKIDTALNSNVPPPTP
jgi:type II secretory pathway component PulJ